MSLLKKDRQLLEEFRTGSARALDQVYRHYYRAVRNFVISGFSFESSGKRMYCRGVCQDADVDDIVQETFRRAFGEKARNQYDGVRPYKNYLFTIARNVVINLLQSRSRMLPVGDVLHQDGVLTGLDPLEAWIATRVKDEAVGMPDEEAGEKLENLEVYGLMVGFLSMLDDQDTRFFRHRFLQGSSQEETARTFGWTRSRVRKAEDRLRRAFLCHIQGTGYLERRREANIFRRPADPEAARRGFALARQVYHRDCCLRPVDPFQPSLQAA